jgi:hypothetical protein
VTEATAGFSGSSQLHEVSWRLHVKCFEFVLAHRDYAEAAERSSIDGGSDSARGLPLSAYYCTPLHLPLTNDKQANALVYW